MAYFMVEVFQTFDILQGHTSKRSIQHFSSNVKNVEWYSISNNQTIKIFTNEMITVKMLYTCEYSFTLNLIYYLVSK